MRLKADLFTRDLGILEAQVPFLSAFKDSPVKKFEKQGSAFTHPFHFSSIRH